MTRTQLLHELENLSPWERLELIEAAVHLLQKDLRKGEQQTIPSKENQQLAKAAQVLLKDYEEDKELTSFMALDGEAFHESR